MVISCAPETAETLQTRVDRFFADCLPEDKKLPLKGADNHHLMSLVDYLGYKQSVVSNLYFRANGSSVEVLNPDTDLRTSSLGYSYIHLESPVEVPNLLNLYRQRGIARTYVKDGDWLWGICTEFFSLIADIPIGMATIGNGNTWDDLFLAIPPAVAAGITYLRHMGAKDSYAEEQLKVDEILRVYDKSLSTGRDALVKALTVPKILPC